MFKGENHLDLALSLTGEETGDPIIQLVVHVKDGTALGSSASWGARHCHLGF